MFQIAAEKGFRKGMFLRKSFFCGCGKRHLTFVRCLLSYLVLAIGQAPDGMIQKEEEYH
ncbi:hypothetical protein HMPREF1141_1711 [Clostridium sp. MSTE9]|nr:hypothetical protein HMPREF1141_1711 [Clostridium sp. MSTE9]